LSEGGTTMSRPKRAIETTGTIDIQHQLVLDEPLQVEVPTRVRVIILIPDEDIDEKDWVKTAANDRSFEFLKDSAEDIYTLSDGSPFDNKG
jgi:hypothetical protein